MIARLTSRVATLSSVRRARSSRTVRRVVPVAAAILAVWMGASPAFAQQTVTGDIIKMVVNNDTTPALWVKSSSGGDYVYQYYGQTSWGTVVWVNGSAQKFSSQYQGQTAFTPVSNTVVAVTGGQAIVTVVDLGATGLRLTQRFTYINGQRTITKEWTLTNTGSTTYSDLRLFHGGDSYFGGVDSAYSFYDAANSMVYLRNNDYTNWGLMGFYANPATPAAHYYGGQYSTGTSYATGSTGSGHLPDTVTSSYTDAGYYLEWNRVSLAPGQSWSIQAFEVWTPGGSSVQVLSPANQNTVPDSTANLSFTVQNLGTTSATFPLAASSSAGWTTSLPNGSSVTVGANSNTAVPVQVTVPPGASGTNTVTLTASGGGTSSAATTLTVVVLSLGLSPESVAFGSVSPGSSATPQPVTVTNNSGAAVTLGTIAATAPFGKSSDTCSGTVLANGASCTVSATFSPSVAGTYNASLNVPVTDPVLVTRTVALSGSSSSNAAPVITQGTSVSVTMSEDGAPTPFSLTLNATDANGDTLTWSISGAASHGTATASGTGTSKAIGYTPAANYAGPDSFVVRVSDGALADTITVNVTVTAVNDPPSAVGEAYGVVQDTVLAEAAPGVLANDSDLEGQALSASIVQAPQHGTLVLGAAGNFVYTPAFEYTGADGFVYAASDGIASTNATVSISVLAGLFANGDFERGNLSAWTEGRSYNPGLKLPQPFTGASIQFRAGGTDKTNIVGGPSVTPLSLSDAVVPAVKYPRFGRYATVVNYRGSSNNANVLKQTATVLAHHFDPADGKVHVRFAYVPVLDNPSHLPQQQPFFYVVVRNKTRNGAVLYERFAFANQPGVPWQKKAGTNYLYTDWQLVDVPAGPGLVAVGDELELEAVAAGCSLGGHAGWIYVDGFGTAVPGLFINATGPAAINPSAPLTYTFTYRNNGATTLNAVTAAIKVPDQTTFASVSSPACSHSGGTVTCALASSVTPGQSGTFTVTVNVGAGATGTITLGNYHIAGSAYPALLGSTVLTSVTSATLADLEMVSNTDGRDTGALGDAVTYTFVARNNGPATVTNASITNPLAGLTAPSWTCTPAGGATCGSGGASGPIATTATLPSGGTVTFVATGSVTSGRTLVNTATIAAPSGYNDPDTSNNSYQDVTAIANVAPAGVADTGSTLRNTTLTKTAAQGVLANDTDANGDSLSATLVTPVSHGTLTLNADGSYTYAPARNYVGPDSFVYRASDGLLQSGDTTVSLTVAPVANTAPSAAANSFAATEDTTLTVGAPGVLGNDTDAQGDALTAVLVTGPASGSLTLNANGSFSFTPSPDANGPVTFTYKANDGAADSAPATVTITVAAVNDAPASAVDAYSVAEDETLTVAAPGVLGNDIEVDGQAMTASVVTNVRNGTLALGANGAFTYVPRADWSGTDSFTYRASDGTLTGNTVTVTLTVTPVNDLPVALGESYVTAEDTPLTVAAPGVLANDRDPEGARLVAVKVSDPANGSVALAADGSFTYTPAQDFAGTDSFTYAASDGSGSSAPVTVTITVGGENDAPASAPDSFTTAEDTPLTVPAPGVLANDRDADRDAMTVRMVTPPAHGTLTLDADGGFLYTPAANWHGTDRFAYLASDGVLDGAPVTVTILVTSVNDAPSGAADAYTTNEDESLVVAAPGVLLNDGDIESNPLQALLTEGPAHGALRFNGDGSFVYTPATDYFGPDGFTYLPADSDTGVPVTVSIAVAPVNDAPEGWNDAYSVLEDTTLTVAAPGVLGNDTDVDSTGLTASLLTGPANAGSFTLNADGSFTYVPEANFFGTDTFTYQTSDGEVTAGPITVTLYVAWDNDVPVAVTEQHTTAEDTPLTAPTVLGNDADSDIAQGVPQTLTAVLVGAPRHGSVTLNPDGTFTYTPAADYHGPDRFAYAPNDELADGSTVVVNITITPVNDAPTVADDIVTMTQDTILRVGMPGVLANDYDKEGQPITATKASDPAHGTVTMGADGRFLYTPTRGFSGTDSFTYTATDGAATSAPATVTITVAPSPFPIDEGFRQPTPGGCWQLFGSAALTAGADDNLGDGWLSLTSYTGGVLGGAVCNTPFSSEDGVVVTFDYAAHSGVGGDGLTMFLLDGSVTVPTLGPGGSGLGYAADSVQPGVTGGYVGVALDESGWFSDANVGSGGPGRAPQSVVVRGSGSSMTGFSYVGGASLAAAPWSTTVDAVMPVVARPVRVTVANQQVRVEMDFGDGWRVVLPAADLASAYGQDPTPPSFKIGFSASNLTSTNAHQVRNLAIGRPVTLGVSISDGRAVVDQGQALTYTATITNDTTNDVYYLDVTGTAPAALTGVTWTCTAGPGAECLTAGGSGAALAATLHLPKGSHATLSITGTVPAPTAGGTRLSFPIQLSPSPSLVNLGQASAVDETTVTNVAPVAAADAYTTIEETPLSVAAPGVLGNDVDANGDALAAVLVTAPAHGTLALAPGGGFLYTPAADFFGTDTFTYRASDGLDAGNVVPVVVTVTNVNDAPAITEGAAVGVTMDENEAPAPFALTLHATDADGDVLTWSVVSQAAHGTASVAGTGASTAIAYTPVRDYHGPDSFVVRVSDGVLTDTITVNVTVTSQFSVAALSDATTYVNNQTREGLVALPGPYDDQVTHFLVTEVDGGELFLADGTTPVRAGDVVSLAQGAAGFRFTPARDSFANGRVSIQPSTGPSSAQAGGPITTATITVVAVPVLRLPDPPVTFTEEGAPVAVLPNAEVLYNGLTLTGAKITLDAGFVAGQDVLAVTPVASIQASWNATTGVLTLTGVATDAAYQQTLRSLTYRNTDTERPVTAAPRGVTVTLGASALFNAETGHYYEFVPSRRISWTTARAAAEDRSRYGQQGYPAGMYGLQGYLATITSATENAFLTEKVSGSAWIGANDALAEGEWRWVTGPEGLEDEGKGRLFCAGPASACAVRNGSYLNWNVREPNNTGTNPPGEDYAHMMSWTRPAGMWNDLPNGGGGGSYESTGYLVEYGGRPGDPVLDLQGSTQVTVLAVDDAPVGQPESYLTAEDTPLAILAPGVIANDRDPDGGAVTASLVAGAAHGTVVIEPSGAFLYTPAPDFAGTDTFTYVPLDTVGPGAPVTVTVQVTPVNDAPAGVADAYQAAEDDTLTVAGPGVLANDVDRDSASLAAALVESTRHGTLTLRADGGFTYVPARDFAGVDRFVYQPGDGAANGAPVTVTLTVVGVNDAPLGAPDAFQTDEDVPLTVPAPGVLANDGDVETPWALQATLRTPPAYGSLTLRPDGGFTYTPARDFNGRDAFVYVPGDGIDEGEPVTVELHVGGTNDVPLAEADRYQTAEDVPLDVAWPGVLANDTDPDGTPIEARLVRAPDHGTVTLQPNGSLRYVPDPDWHGTDVFLYASTDLELTGSAAVVSVTVTPVNDAPVAVGDARVVNEDGELVLGAPGVLGNDVDADGDVLAATLVDGPAHGTLTLQPDGSVVYRPHADWHGTDQFTYAVTDGAETSAPVPVTLTVVPVNDVSAAVAEDYAVAEDAVLAVSAPGVLGNDTDVDGDQLRAILAEGPQHGSLRLSLDGSFVYTPRPDYHGADRFAYRANDGTVSGDPVVVTITVTPVNDAPEAWPDTVGGREDVPLVVPAPGLLGNDRDIDSDGLVAAVTRAPEHGTVVLSPDGSFVFTPAPGWSGVDSFTYLASDGELSAGPVTVTLAIHPTNDPPVGMSERYTTEEDTPLGAPAPGAASVQGGAVTSVLANDADEDGDALTAMLVEGARHGAVTLAADGTFHYVPDADYYGPDRFVYAPFDGIVAGSAVVVDIDVTPVPDAPTGTGDTFTTREDTPLRQPVSGVLENDVDVESRAIVAELRTPPSHGTLVFNDDGSFTYTPHAGFWGEATFVYRPTAGTQSGVDVAVTIVVVKVDDTLHFAEGVTSETFQTWITLANTSDADAGARLTFYGTDQPAVEHLVTVPANRRITLPAGSVEGLQPGAFAMTVKAPPRVLAARTVIWGQGDDRGASLGLAVPASTTWYLAEGATLGNFELFYLLANPNATDAEVEITYLVERGTPIVKTYTVPAQRRLTVWVDYEAPALAHAELSASVRSTNDVPVVVERAMYLRGPGGRWLGGHAGAGLTETALEWYFAEGATGGMHNLATYLLLGNPGDVAAEVEVTYVLDGAPPVTRTHVVAPRSRHTIPVNAEAEARREAGFGMRVVSTNGVPVVAERAMWWPRLGTGEWQEGHVGAGSLAAGVEWGSAEGLVAGPSGADTYLLVANPSTSAGTVRVTLHYEDGRAPTATDLPIGAERRLSLSLRALFPEAAGTRFSVHVESVGEAPAPIVVEESLYWSDGRMPWSFGTSAPAKRLR